MYYAFFGIGQWPGPFSSSEILIKIHSIEKVERRSIENTEPAPGINSPQGPVIPTDFPGQLCSGNEIMRLDAMRTWSHLEAAGNLSDASLKNGCLAWCRKGGSCGRSCLPFQEAQIWLIGSTCTGCSQCSIKWYFPCCISSGEWLYMIQIYMQTWMCIIHYIPALNMFVHLLLHQGCRTKQSCNMPTQSS